MNKKNIQKIIAYNIKKVLLLFCFFSMKQIFFINYKCYAISRNGNFFPNEKNNLIGCLGFMAHQP